MPNVGKGNGIQTSKLSRIIGVVCVCIGILVCLSSTNPIAVSLDENEPISVPGNEPKQLLVNLTNFRPWNIKVKPEASCCQVPGKDGFHVIPGFGTRSFDFSLDVPRLPSGSTTADVGFSVENGEPVGVRFTLR